MATTMNTRRTTLGPLTMSTVNSRASLGPARHFTEAKSSRMSMGGAMGNSRMSMGGASLHGNSRKSIQPRMSSVSTASRLPDPRNIGEKQFMNTSIRQLIDYLMRHGFDGAVSPKILSKPTNKDFTQIILFLFRQFDPNYKFTGKFEDEMIGMFKYLGYPFTIAKSNISAVGSPHAWPTLLGCIMWLIDLLNYSEVSNSAMQESEMDADSDPSASEKGFYRYLSKAYEMFLSGKDEQYAHLEEQFISSFDNKNVLIKDQIEALEKRNQALSAEIEQIKNRSEYMPELVNKKREFQQNFAQFSSLMDELKRHRDQLKEKNEQRETEIGSLSSSIAALHEEIDSLHLRIQTQDLSPEDVKNMVTERQRLEEAYQQAAENRHALQRSIKDLEASLRAKVLSLEDSVRIYTGFAEGLKLVPASARNARGQELGIEIDIRAKKREGLLKTDIRNDVLPVLQQMRVELNETTLSIRAEMMQEQEAAEEIEGQMIELKESTVDLDAKLRRAEATYRREKEMLDQSASLHSKEMDAMEGRLVQLRDTAADEAKITAARRRLAENSSIRAARKTEHERKKTAMVESVMETVSQCAMHREHVQAEMEALKEAYSDRLQMFLSSAQPFQSENYADVSRDILNGSVSVAGEEQLFLSQYMPQSAQQADSSALAAGASFSHVTRRRTSARAEEEEEVVAGLDSSALSGADDADLSAEQMDQTGRDKTPEASMGSLQYMDIYPQDSAFKNHAQEDEEMDDEAEEEEAEEGEAEEEEEDDDAGEDSDGAEEEAEDAEDTEDAEEIQDADVSQVDASCEGAGAEEEPVLEGEPGEEEGDFCDEEGGEEGEMPAEEAEEYDDYMGEGYDTVNFGQTADFGAVVDVTRQSMPEVNPRRALYDNFDDVAARDRRLRSENKKYRKSMA